jgi:hypothetical protein
LRRILVIGGALACLVNVSAARAATYGQLQKLVPPGLQVGNFGDSVAVSANGQTAIVAAPRTSPVGTVLVYGRGPQGWMPQAAIKPTDARGLIGVGTSVALSADGNTALIGSFPDPSSPGAVWVYVRSGTSWIEQQKIVPTDPSQGELFGSDVALSGDGTTALVGGGASDDSDGGGAWVYVRSGSTWNEQQKVVPDDETGTDSSFGSAVSLSADGATALIGGPGDGTTGAAWVYTRSGAEWSEAQKLTPPAGAGAFGSSVALGPDGALAAAGAPQETPGSPAGAAWVYQRTGAGWTEDDQLSPSGDGVEAGRFGSAISASNDQVLVGGSNPLAPGAAWLFAGSGGDWAQEQMLTATNEVLTPANFGVAVALSADDSTVIVGGAFDDGMTGAAWMFASPPPSPPTAPATRPALAWSHPRMIDRGSRTRGDASCNARACAAISDDNHLLISRTTGDLKRWSRTRSPAVDSNASNPQISCPTVNFCLTEGGHGGVQSLSGASHRSRAEHVSGDLIACPTAHFCAVATPTKIEISRDPTAVAPKWTVAAPEVVSIACAGSNGHPTCPARITALTCPSAGLCVAVDNAGNAIVVEHLATGISVSEEIHIVGGETLDPLEAVSCPSLKLCAVTDQHGDVLTSADPAAGAGTWVMTKLGNAAAPVDVGSVAGSVSCPTVQLCVTAGERGEIAVSYDPTSPTPTWQTLRIDGSQSLRVTCASAALCLATDKAGKILVGAARPG